MAQSNGVVGVVPTYMVVIADAVASFVSSVYAFVFTMGLRALGNSLVALC